MLNKSIKIGIIGLGYVGLPLAVAFSKKFEVVAYDKNKDRITQLNKNQDVTGEVSSSALQDAFNLNCTNNSSDLSNCNVYVVTVPTPIDRYKNPILSPLISASETISKHLASGDVVIYESTVYPGATEEICIPILEKHSELKFNEEFFVGYSPERINPGDSTRKLEDIVKVTSGSDAKTADFVDCLYKKIIVAGTHKASSIKVAEAAKVIENTQRDVNIALINELAIIFNMLEINTSEVLAAASTKWNFLSFKPGLVGGHCIGVDPYYLTYKAQEMGYYPEMILAGRRLNDNMSSYVAGRLVKRMTNENIRIDGAKVLVMGVTFKENCPDMRNTKVKDLIYELMEFNMVVDAFDPWCTPEDAKKELGLELLEELENEVYDAIILAVPHSQIMELGYDFILRLCKSNYVIYDLKSMLDASQAQIQL